MEFLLAPFESPKGKIRVTDQNIDFTICSYTDTCDTIPNDLSNLLKKENMTIKMMDFTSGNRPDPKLIEQNIAESKFVIFIISKDSLKQPGFVFAMESVILYQSVNPILLYCLDNFFLPSYQDQPDTVRILFEPCNLIYYFNEYANDAAKDILKKFKQLKENIPINNEHFDNSRIFLSYRLLTGKVIASKLYEVLNADYKVSMDNEESFSLEELEKNVQTTNTFILILSSGVFESNWIIKALRFALKYKKQILIVRDYTFNIQEKWKENLSDLKEIVFSCPKVTWISEYSSQCIENLKSLIGPSDSSLLQMNSWVKQHKIEEKLKEKDLSPDWDLPEWGGSILVLLKGLQMCYQFPIEKILDLTLVENSNLKESDWKMLGTLKSLTKLALQCVNIQDEDLKYLPNSILRLALLGLSITDTGLEYVSQTFQNLQMIMIDECSSVSKGLSHLSKCKDLRYLRVVKSQAAPRSDEWLNDLTTNCTKLAYYEDDGTSQSDAGLKYLSRCKSLRVLYIPRYGTISKKITDSGIKLLSQNCPLLEVVDLKGYVLTPKSIEYLSKGCPKIANLRITPNDEDLVEPYQSLQPLFPKLTRQDYYYEKPPSYWLS